MQQQIVHKYSSLIVGIIGIRNMVKPSGLITFFGRIRCETWIHAASHRSYNATCVNNGRTMFATWCFSEIHFHFEIVLQLIVLLLRKVS